MHSLPSTFTLSGHSGEAAPAKIHMWLLLVSKSEDPYRLGAGSYSWSRTCVDQDFCTGRRNRQHLHSLIHCKPSTQLLAAVSQGRDDHCTVQREEPLASFPPHSAHFHLSWKTCPMSIGCRSGYCLLLVQNCSLAHRKHFPHPHIHPSDTLCAG